MTHRDQWMVWDTLSINCWDCIDLDCLWCGTYRRLICTDNLHPAESCSKLGMWSLHKLLLMQCLCRGKKAGEASSIYIFYNVCARPLACFVCNSQFRWKNFFYWSGSNYNSRIEFFALTGPSYVHVSSVLWISWWNWEE